MEVLFDEMTWMSQEKGLSTELLHMRLVGGVQIQIEFRYVILMSLNITA